MNTIARVAAGGMPLPDNLGIENLISMDGAMGILHKGLEKINNFSLGFGIFVAQIFGYYMIWWIIRRIIHIIVQTL